MIKIPRFKAQRAKPFTWSSYTVTVKSTEAADAKEPSLPVPPPNFTVKFRVPGPGVMSRVRLFENREHKIYSGNEADVVGFLDMTNQGVGRKSYSSILEDLVLFTPRVDPSGNKTFMLLQVDDVSEMVCIELDHAAYEILEKVPYPATQGGDDDGEED